MKTHFEKNQTAPSVRVQAQSPFTFTFNVEVVNDVRGVLGQLKEDWILILRRQSLNTYRRAVLSCFTCVKAHTDRKGIYGLILVCLQLKHQAVEVEPICDLSELE